MDNFLDYDEEAGDDDARPEDISLADIVDHLDSENRHASDSDPNANIPEIISPEAISVVLVNSYLTQITDLLERLPVDTLQTTGQALPIPIAV